MEYLGKFLKRKKISNELYRYVFFVGMLNSKGTEMIIGTKTLITEDIDIREAAVIVLCDHPE